MPSKAEMSAIRKVLRLQMAAAVIVVVACSTPVSPLVPNLDLSQRSPLDFQKIFEKVNPSDGSHFLLSVREHSKVAVWQVRDPRLAQAGTTFDIKIAATDAPILFDSSCVNIYTSDDPTIIPSPAHQPAKFASGKGYMAAGAGLVAKMIGKRNEEAQEEARMVGAIAGLSSSVANLRPSPTASSNASLQNLTAITSVMVAEQSATDSIAAQMAVDTRFWPQNYAGCMDPKWRTTALSSEEAPSAVVSPQTQAGGLIGIVSDKAVTARYWLIVIDVHSQKQRQSSIFPDYYDERHYFVFSQDDRVALGRL